MREALHTLVHRILRVPPKPAPPAGGEGTLRVFRASKRYYTYRLALWAIAQIWFVGFAIASAVVLHVSLPIVAARLRTLIWALEMGGFVLLAFQLIVSLVALRIDWEMRWYMTTDRSLRVREGVWNVHEMTLTLANVQNVEVRQGPLQRLLGIADVRVQTAGGGGGAQHDASRHGGADMHVAWLRGVDQAPGIRDLVFERMRGARDTGLGDPGAARIAGAEEVTAALAALREESRSFRHAAVALSDAGGTPQASS